MEREWFYKERLMSSYKDSIDKHKKYVKHNKLFFIVCALFIILHIYNTINGFSNSNLVYFTHNRDWLTIFLIILNPVYLGIWIFSTTLTYKAYKKNINRIKEYKVKYDEIFKIVDYPSYIKKERKEKLENMKF